MNTRLSTPCFSTRLQSALTGVAFFLALPCLAQAPASSATPATPATAAATLSTPTASSVQLSDGSTLSIQGRQAWLTAANGQRAELKKSPLTPRTAAALVVVPDGSVWILGGVDEQGIALRSAERYVPHTQRFEALSSSASSSSASSSTSASLDLIARSQHRATLLLDGRILISGGLGTHGQPLAQAELIDTALLRSQAFNAQLLAERSAHQASLLATDHVLLQGGVGRTGQAAQPFAELFDIQAQRFMPAPADKAGAAQAAATESAAPQVSASLPADSAVDVNADARIGLRFNQAMKPESLNGSTVVLMGPSGRVAPAALSDRKNASSSRSARRMTSCDRG